MATITPNAPSHSTNSNTIQKTNAHMNKLSPLPITTITPSNNITSNAFASLPNGLNTITNNTNTYNNTITFNSTIANKSIIFGIQSTIGNSD